MSSTSTTQRHTPGPWTAGEYDDTSGYDCMTGGISILAGTARRCVAALDGKDHGQEPCQPISAERLSELEANARLIAAAPELAEALRALFEHCAMVHKHWGDGDNSRQANAAIEQATALLARIDGGA